MKITKKVWHARTTGLVARVRLAVKEDRKSIVLTTAAQVYGYHNLRPHLTSLGFETYARRQRGKVAVFINQSPKAGSEPLHNPRLRRALIDLKAGRHDCVILTTAAEAQSYNNMRHNLCQRLGLHFRTARNCTAVMVWKK